MNTAAVPPLDTEKMRISAIDTMRGIVMVIMALDHTRDFFHTDATLFDPTNLEKTTPLLFFTRIITHFCAPTFVFLAGTSIRISELRKTKKDLSIFLLTRGLWLILLEVTVVRFGLLFQFYYDITFFQVIWTIGMSMVVLSALIHLPFNILLALGILITIGHDSLHAIQLKQGDPFFLLWSFVHQVSFIELLPGKSILTNYPFLPWMGIMILGYGLGSWYLPSVDPRLRKKLLFRTGLIAIVIFIVIRFFNIYEPAPWTTQKNALYTFMSFVNVTKYPPSLLYTLMTLGPVLLLLSRLEGAQRWWQKPFTIYGKVPLFYYILHFYLIHFSALLLYVITSGKNLSTIDFHLNAGFGGIQRGIGYSLPIVYLAWILIVIVLYPVCHWYSHYKTTRKHWILSYL